MFMAAVQERECKLLLLVKLLLVKIVKKKHCLLRKTVSIGKVGISGEESAFFKLLLAAESSSYFKLLSATAKP